jgi:Protein of unknown function (DUF1592)/Protein of unknown function (DUF1588)/Protein of unknown function (DUF1595)/Protein of unknown function (DUF1587)/Protein of unknown function (DUF1585)/Planctomycete cytochrome C
MPRAQIFKAFFAATLVLGVAPHGFTQAASNTDAKGHFGLLSTYCYDCHNATDWAGGVAFDTLQEAEVPQDIKLWEATVRKLRGNLMPPPGSKQPSQAEKDALVGWLETSLDARTETPRAGHVSAQRLNRTEYANAVKTLFDVEIKVEDFLPPEIEMDGFDNIATVLTVSPSFLDQYISAARFVAKQALGNATPKMGKTLYLPPGGGQDSYVDGMPLGSRGGMRFKHNFPADGEYHLNILDLDLGLYPQSAESRQTILIFVDGNEIFRGDLGGPEDLGVIDKEGAVGRARIMERFSKIPARVKAGVHEVIITFVERARAMSDEHVGGGSGPGAGGAFFFGRLRLARILQGIEVVGPYGATTLGSTPSRDKIFVCHPASAAEESACAERIASNLARKAYRRPATAADVKTLLRFFAEGRKESGSFDGGVQQIVSAVLSSPDFLYRAITPKGDAHDALQPLSDLELASRLSFFLWSDLPDDELLTAATNGKLSDPAEYDRQVLRMLKDKRAEALVTGFAMRWLNVDDLGAVDPDTRLFPAFSDALREDFSTEIELFLKSILLENRSVVDLLSADHSFVNERLARHYGMKNIFGTQFRRVQLPDENRRGLLGKSAVLLRTSYGDRTSPVLRGAWVLERILGTAATPPPPGVETNLTAPDGAKPTTLRARLELHRQAKSCNQCHGVIDPIGLAMENFEVTGAWREQDSGFPVDASTVLPNGVAITGVTPLRNQLLARPQMLVQTITQKLLMYGTGREVEPADLPQVRRIVHETAANNYRFFDIVMGVVHSSAFKLQAPPHTAKAAVQPLQANATDH